LALALGHALAAVSLSTTTPAVQNFDTIGTTATATLPTDFKADRPATVRTVGSYAAAGTATTQAGGTNLSSSAANGTYNFGATASATDRAIGFLSSGTATASGNLYTQLVNNTGGNLSGLQISYDVEKYRNGTNANGFSIQLYYSTNGTSWTSAGATFLTSFPGDANSNGFANAPGATVPVSATLSQAIPNGSNFYLAWNYSVTSGTTTTNAQALAIDNISILGISGGGSTNPTGVGSANPNSVSVGGTTLLTVAVTPGTNPSSTGITVNANLSSIGGSNNQQFFDNGTNGDVTAGDNTFSFSATVANGTTGGAKNLTATVSDAQARSSVTPPFTLTVLTPTPPTGTGAANPAAVQAGTSTLLTVAVTPGANPTSTGIGVTGDLSSIGGLNNQQFYDDGTNGDVTGGDNTFSFNATVSAATANGSKSLPITITDGQGRTGNASISLSVQSAPTPAGAVVISQVYGGGGNAGATLKNDFIEIFNRSSNPVDLTGWSVQYASPGGGAGAAWNRRTPLSGVINPGQYFLIQEAQGAGGSTNLPTPDITGTIAMGAGDGKVALVRNNVDLPNGCPIGNPNVIDFVGYGTADCFEGPQAAPQLSNTTAALRARDGCKDTDFNGVNFTEVAPAPRNSSSPSNFCPAGDEAPEVFSTTPANGTTNVSLTSNVTINFDQAVNVAGSWYQISCGTSGTHTATVTGGPTSFTLDPDTNFAGSEQCTVTVLASQVTDQDLQDPPDNMAADYVFSFTTLIPRDPAEHLVMGNPSNATADLNNLNNYLLLKDQYVHSYNCDRGTPNWVSWHLDSSWLGTAPRQDDFRNDTTTPAPCYQVQGTDYSGSGFDRGHMTPSADRTSSIPDNSATFLMTNMVPQAPDNNQGPWADLENDLRAIVGQGKELYIISGGAGTGGVGSNGARTTIANGNVTVPAQTWKVVMVLPVGNNDVSRVDNSTRTFAVIMPNQQGIRNDDWRKYLATVDQVEALTGYDFYSNVDPAIQAVIEARLDDELDTAPVANGQSATTAEDTPKQITLTASDFNVNNALTYTIVTPPANGMLSGTGGTLTYAPDENYNGPDSFTFKVNDGDKDSNVATVNINVTEVNDSPVANNDSKSTAEDTSLTFPVGDLLINDTAGASNESGQTLTVTSVTSTPDTHGTATLNAGQVTYTPAANFNGTASFDYQVCDNGTTGGAANIQCATGTVNITVNAVNDDPVATDDAATTDEDVAVTIDVTGNDHDLDGDSLSPATAGSGSHGTTAIVDNKIVYTPAADFNGSDSFTYTVSDSHGGTATANVTVTINPVNDKPTADAQSVSTNEDNAAALTLTGSDVETSAASLSFEVVASPTHGTLSGTGSNLTYTPAANYNGGDSFTFKVTDTGDGSSSALSSSEATVSINVTAVNDAPTANSQSAVTDEDTPKSLTLSGSDTETPAGNLTYTVTTGPAHGTLTGTGANRTYAPNLNYNGPDSFQFTVTDTGDGSSVALTSAPASVSIAVESINDAPVANAGPDQTLECAGALTLNGSASSDPDGDTPLTYQWREGTTVLGTGATLNTSRPFGSHTITLKVTDPSGAFSEDTVIVNVVDTTMPTITPNNLTILLDNLTIVFNSQTVTINGLTFPFNGYSFAFNGQTFAFNGQTVTINGQPYPLNGQTITLWSPNKKYHTIKVSDLVKSASDSCDSGVNLNSVVIANVTSDEGSLSNNDIIIGADCKSVQLKADRNGNGNGRVYTITFRVRDAAGNATTLARQVIIPRNGIGAIDSGVAYTVTSSCQ
jgi:DNA/RNA endonuclease G (NUC1)